MDASFNIRGVEQNTHFAAEILGANVVLAPHCRHFISVTSTVCPSLFSSARSFQWLKSFSFISAAVRSNPEMYPQ